MAATAAPTAARLGFGGGHNLGGLFLGISGSGAHSGDCFFDLRFGSGGHLGGLFFYLGYGLLNLLLGLGGNGGRGFNRLRYFGFGGGRNSGYGLGSGGSLGGFGRRGIGHGHIGGRHVSGGRISCRHIGGGGRFGDNLCRGRSRRGGAGGEIDANSGSHYQHDDKDR